MSWTQARLGKSRTLIPDEAAADRILLALQRYSLLRENRIRRLCEAGFTVDQAAALHDLMVDIAGGEDDE